MNPKILLGCGFVGLLSAATASASVIVNFDSPGGDGGTNYSGYGVDTNISSDTEHWNQIVPNGTTTPGSDSNNSLTTITLAETQTSAYGGGSTPTIRLFQPYSYVLDTQTTLAGVTTTTVVYDNLTLNNLPQGDTYSLYLYDDNSGYANRGSIFSVTGGTADQGIYSTNNSTTAGTSGQTSSFVEGQNYVLFTGTVSGTIFVTYTANTNATGISNNLEGDFSGLQLLLTPTPEPATLGLMALACLGLTKRRRRSAMS